MFYTIELFTMNKYKFINYKTHERFYALSSKSFLSPLNSYVNIFLMISHSHFYAQDGLSHESPSPSSDSCCGPGWPTFPRQGSPGGQRRRPD